MGTLKELLPELTEGIGVRREEIIRDMDETAEKLQREVYKRKRNTKHIRVKGEVTLTIYVKLNKGCCERTGKTNCHRRQETMD